ncbi:DUF4097 family beta strand repeat-containing protein [Pseudolysinimonas yzui]|uniref:DUF4097 domain-containing protein n=1 Tax=Pseudolysinimonas yzui TaxID=2708254 RepID=A0A8J3DTR5_9MICO|nr:DUF4097 family beta strand repeat-containing protein [Pseudolysinimonas yzui]GHF04435.1 hypothetical protein GCM10011600_01020 [Pseudolysinimonas yzui]
MTAETPQAPARRNGALIAVLIVIAALVLLAVGAAVIATVVRSQVHTDQTVEIGDRLEVDIPTAELTFVASDRDDVRIEVDGAYLFGAPEVTTTTSNGLTRMTGGCPTIPFSICSVEVTVELPADLDLDIVGTNGRISIDGVTGAIDVITTNGGIDVSGAEGDLALSTTNGSVTVTDASSTDVVGATTNGAVSLSFATAPDRVEARTTNGSVAITLPDDDEPYAIDAQTTNGSVDLVRVTNDPDADRSISAHSVNGSVEIVAE